MSGFFGGVAKGLPVGVAMGREIEINRDRKMKRKAKEKVNKLMEEGAPEAEIEAARAEQNKLEDLGVSDTSGITPGPESDAGPTQSPNKIGKAQTPQAINTMTSPRPAEETSALSPAARPAEDIAFSAKTNNPSEGPQGIPTTVARASRYASDDGQTPIPSPDIGQPPSVTSQVATNPGVGAPAPVPGGEGRPAAAPMQGALPDGSQGPTQYQPPANQSGPKDYSKSVSYWDSVR